MVDRQYDVRWDTVALIQFKEIFVYIRKDSYQNALKVKKKILECIAKIKAEPMRFGPDKFRIDHNEAFRSFEVYNIRVTYFIDDVDYSVNIIRVRSTRQEPISY
ncbi:ParE toxin of type II toxin-antitoxin system, parDE [Dyadobacter soli]|uniref:ParE toxin of type II toxin-antitoxin system, parDE n=1 Tax=Dyadobacter soli TaxID=659014 RepID=A0A1G7HPH0_9BACT|nr:type II toxin-antitoxin system RelE/ParE family toxin [Dyadobacter soli]SDF02194.1 ParE toxin of type II toxin-antitoxin system, parDE [Dyadobacter soli]